MKIRNLIKGILTVAAGVLLLVFREEAVSGVRQGIKTCLEVVVPSLFPFMVLSFVAVRSRICEGTGTGTEKLFRKITGFPVAVLPVILFGFIGGYPVGMNIAAELYENGIADRNSMLRLVSFCVNAGPAFIITAVGTMIFGSSVVGFCLFFSVCTASLLSGMLTSLFIKTDKKMISAGVRKTDFQDVFVSSVESSCKNIFVMCGWILLFSCLSGIIEKFPVPFFVTLWSVFGEVTAGVVAAEKNGGLPLTAMCISSGGLCVMCQLLPVMKKCGVRIREYLTFRIVNSIFSCIIMKILVLLIPVSVETFAYQDIKLSTGCASASILLLITGVVFVADMSSGRVKKFGIKDLF